MKVAIWPVSTTTAAAWKFHSSLLNVAIELDRCSATDSWRHAYRRRSSPLNDGCRTIPSFVTSEYVISASKRGSTQVVSRFFTGTVSGDIGRTRGSSARRIAAAVLWSHPVSHASDVDQRAAFTARKP
jgi:hypothetical protein